MQTKYIVGRFIKVSFTNEYSIIFNPDSVVEL